ncbi:MAG: thioesterase family protein [Gammaproteobacteria bacterium]|jgi:acyl-CoA thioester hydrolase
MRHALLTGEAELEVPFQDLDPMNVVWHGNYFRYFEAARVVLLRTIDYDYPRMRESNFMWPIVEAHVRFPRPLEYGQRIRVLAGLVEWENRMKIAYQVRDARSDERLTTGYTIQCAVRTDTGELQLVSPPILLDRLKPYLS